MFFPYRDDNPRQRFPLVTVCLMVANVLIQVYQATMSPERAGVFLRQTGAIPWEISHLTDLVRWPDHPVALLPIPLTLISSMFVHGGWLHLVSNLWYLWIFGDNVEDSMGHLRFVLFYLLAGLAAALLQILVDPGSTVPTVGASGAIAGVLGAYLLLFPRARIQCLIFVFILITTVEVRAYLVLGFWFVIQVARGFTEGSVTTVAWFAHIGGFVAGLILIKLFVRQRPSAPWREEA